MYIKDKNFTKNVTTIPLSYPEALDNDSLNHQISSQYANFCVIENVSVDYIFLYL